MAGKKKLGIELQAQVTVNPDEVAIKTKGLNRKIEAQFKEAIKGLSVTAGGRFKVAPDIERMSPAEFAKFKKQYKAETDRLYEEAKKIQEARLAAAEKGGKPPSAQSYQLAQAKELAAQARRSSLELIEADRAINAATRRKIIAGEKLSKREETLAARRYEATKNSIRSLQQLSKLQADQNVFDPATGDYVKLRGRNIKGLQRSLKVLSDEAAAYGKVVSQVNKSRIDQAAAAKAERDSAKATEAASKARRDGLRSLRDYSKELRRLKSVVPTSPSGILSQAKRSEGLAKAAAAQRYKVDDLLASKRSGLGAKQLKDAIRLREKLNALEKEARANAESLNKAYENRSTREAASRARAKEEARLAAKRKADLKKVAELEERVSKARRNSVSDLRKNQAALRSIRGLEAETAGQARAYASQAGRVADLARKQYNNLKSLKSQVLSSGVEIDPRALKSLNSSIARYNKLYRQASSETKRFNTAAKELNVTLGQGSLLVRQFFRYALGYGALYQALGAVNALKTSVVELDNALYSIKAIANATDKEMVKISGAIKRVALETKYTTKEVADAARVLSQAGVTASELPNTLEAVAKFAAGTETEIKTAADLVSTMRNVFTELDDLDIANQLTKAINISKLTGDDLRTILGISAQVAKQYNLTSQNYLSAVTTLRNAGLKASTTATGLRQGLNELFSPDNKTVKALQQRYAEIGEKLTSKEVRDKFFSFTGELNPLLAAIRELNRLGFTGAGKKSLSRGFDIRAANALTALVNNIDQLEASQTKLASGNQVFKASATQMDSLTASVDNLSAAFTVLSANMAEGPIRSLEDFIDKMTETVKWITELDTKARSLGEGGAGQIAGTVVSGGILGSLLGRTPAKRALGALAGAAAGGYIGTKQLEDRARGEESLVSPETLNTLAGVITFFSLFSGSGRLKKFFGTKGDAEKLAKSAEKSLGAVAYFMSLLTKETFLKVGGFLLRAAKSLTLVGLATTAAMFLFDKLMSDEDSEQKKREAHLDRIKALRDKAESARQRVEKIEKVSARYESAKVADYANATVISDDSVGGELQRNAEALLDYQQAFSSLFGSRSADEIRKIEKALIDYRDTGFTKGTAEYTKALENLSNVTGITDISGDVEEQVNYLANTLKGLRNSVAANVEALNRDLQQAFENVKSGAATEQDKALLKVVESGDAAIQLALDAAAGNISEDTDALLKSIQAFWDRFAEANREVSGLVEAELEAKKAQLDAFVSEALYDVTSTSDKNVLKIKANAMAKSLEAVGESGIAYIDELVSELEVLQRRLDLQTKRLKRASAPADQVSQSRAAADNVALFLGALRKRRVEVQGEIETSNERTVQKVSAALDELTRLSDAQIKSAAGNDKALHELLLELKNNKTARQGVLTPVVTADGKRLPPTAFNSSNGLLSPNAQTRAILAAVERATQAKGKSPDEQIGKVAKSPYQQDPALYREIYNLDRLIAEAKKKNLRLLTQDNEDNPLRAKRDLLLRIKNEEINVERAYLEKLRKAYGDDPVDDKHRVELQKARAGIQKKLVEREKISADYQAQREEFVRKYQDNILSSAEKRFSLEKERLSAELANAVSSGDSERAARLVKRIGEVKQELLDIEITNLQLSEQDAKLTKLTSEYKQQLLETSLRRLQIETEVAALEQRHKLDLLASAGGQKGLVREAFLSASGSRKSPTKELEDIQRQLRVDLQYSLQKSSLATSRYNEAKASGAGEEELSTLKSAAIEASVQTAELAGRLYSVNQQLEGNALSFENFRETWLNSTDAMAESLKSSVAVWYQESPRTIQTFLEAVGNGIQAGLGRVFNAFIDNAITQLVQSSMDYVLEFFDAKQDKKMQVTAYEVYVQTSDVGPFQGGTSPLVNRQSAPNKQRGFGEGVPESADSGGLAVQSPQDEQSDPILQEKEATEENTSSIDANTAVNLALSGNTQGLARQLILSQLTQRLSDAKKAGETVSITSALAANTLAVRANTGALYETAGFGAKSGGVLKAAGGGVLKGPGTGTSDSLRGTVIDSSGRRQPIRVSTGEAILTANAVDILGEDFVHAINKMKPGKFASGGFPGKKADTGTSRIVASVLNAPAPEVTTEPKIINLLDQNLLVDAMQSDNGEKVILNTIQRNSDSLSPFLKG